jgi:hypothetical protein
VVDHNLTNEINSPKDQRRDQDEAERQENEHCMSFLNERQKRTFMRRIERGDRDSAIAFAHAVDKKSPDFDFDGFDDEDDFSEEEEDEEEETSSGLAEEEEIES